MLGFLSMLVLLAMTPGPPSEVRIISEPPDYVTIPGYDYWLPDWVTQHEHARLVATGSVLIDNIAQLEGDWAQAWRPRWKWFHVGDGTFNWAQFDAKLADAASTGSTLQMNLFSGEADYVPPWVLAKHQVTPADYVPINGRVYAPIWRAGVRREFEAFVRAVGERYRGHPQISSWYVHGISASQGEELWLGHQDAANALYYAGCPPETLAVWLGDRLDAFAAAFKGYTHQLMWVGEVESNRYHQLPSGETGMRWSDAASVLAHKAWQHGMGHRGGNIENMWNHAGWKSMADTSWAQQVVVGPWDTWDHRHGYLQHLEHIWPYNDPKIAVGEENEEYWEELFGPAEHRAVRYELSMLRALQLRVNNLWVHGTGVVLDPALTKYVRLSMGRWYADTPDVFTRLCSAPSSDYYVGGGGVPGIDGRLGLHYMRNIEKLLHQRDIPASEGVRGGVTVPVERAYRNFNALNLGHAYGSAYWYDNLALRTDLATGNSCVYFQVDPRWEVDWLVWLMVTYRDSGRGAWRVEYNSQLGATSTDWVINQNSGKIRTAMFRLRSPVFEGHPRDFHILVEDEDVAFRLVRLIR